MFAHSTNHSRESLSIRFLIGWSSCLSETRRRGFCGCRGVVISSRTGSSPVTVVWGAFSLRWRSGNTNCFPKTASLYTNNSSFFVFVLSLRPYRKTARYILLQWKCRGNNKVRTACFSSCGLSGAVSAVLTLLIKTLRMLLTLHRRDVTAAALTANEQHNNSKLFLNSRQVIAFLILFFPPAVQSFFALRLNYRIDASFS